LHPATGHMPPQLKSDGIANDPRRRHVYSPSGRRVVTKRSIRPNRERIAVLTNRERTGHTLSSGNGSRAEPDSDRLFAAVSVRRVCPEAEW
jgi:hypothetical protein